MGDVDSPIWRVNGACSVMEQLFSFHDIINFYKFVCSCACVRVCLYMETSMTTHHVVCTKPAAMFEVPRVFNVCYFPPRLYTFATFKCTFNHLYAGPI